jgi:CheY-like chemotaxis protein
VEACVRPQIRETGFDVLRTVGTVRTPARLVLVEDHQDSLEALSVILGEKYEVFGYASPTEALKAVEAVKPDVLVLDIGMGPIDGVECLKRIRAIRGADAPAVAFTGFARDRERQAFLAAGFQAVVVKPVDPGELVGVIDALLSPALTVKRQ